MKKAVLLVSHGSGSPKTKEEILKLINILKKRTGEHVYEYAFLDVESPSIPEGIDLCAAKGAQSIVILLNFLNSGQHVDVDIPAIVAEAEEKYPQIRFTITKPVGQHEKIYELFADMIDDA